MHNMIESTEEKTKEACELAKNILCFVSAEAKTDLGAINLDQAGALIDMYKDLCESEKNHWKACYYRKMVEGMEPPSEEELREYGEGPMGYDNWRYPSSGRFARTGRGTRYGYEPSHDMMPQFMHDDMRKPITWDQNDDRYGKAYKDWMRARKHYTETNSQRDMDEMTLHAKEHVADVMTSIREMYKNANPELKKELKKDLTTLVGEMPA